ncbi:RNA-guided endonuclease TnpB family protein [Pedobacter panaciterrae]|uniref:RNA-guided endonuclease TnpB family protein n=1 Tax=Pedobacter panaciterrae TaxID=363849 RepID=UPI002594F320|nr:RNA-guided endonuclease TnpB family protein [uncultured Pedobacter sp.]
MKTIYKTYLFALRPTKEQEDLLNKHLGCARFVFNHFLNERIEQYKEEKKSSNYYQQAASMTQLKKKVETQWLKEVNSQSLQAALRNLDTAFLNFFRGHARFPRFKSKRKRNSFAVPQFVVVHDHKVYFPKFKEGIRLIEHREIKGEVKHCTISKTPTGKFFVSILCEVLYIPIQPTSKHVGIDLGVKDFAITSDGIRFKNNHHLKQYESALATAQKHLSRKVKGSNSRNRQRLKVAAIHEKITNTRLDLLHKVSTQITNAYDTICIEDLNVKGMMANHKLAKHIADASWGTFVRLLEYKSDWNNKRIIKIGRFYPSSKTCNQCGYIHHKLKLSERSWTCPNGHTLNRDINASKNILEQGLRIMGAELSHYTDGDLNQTSVKEAQV